MLTVVTGAPCSGKSTWVRDHAKPGDLIIDMDRIALALSHEQTEHHDYPPHIRAAARAARNAAANQAIATHRSGYRAWLIESAPTKDARRRYHQAGATIHPITTSRAICLQRAAEQRPPWVSELIHTWFNQHHTPTLARAT